jgi:hypothetical protein
MPTFETEPELRELMTRIGTAVRGLNSSQSFEVAAGLIGIAVFRGAADLDALQDNLEAIVKLASDFRDDTLRKKRTKPCPR